MLKKINKKYIYIVLVLFLTLSFIVGFSLVNSSFTLATGSISMETKSCSNSKLYDRIACMSSLDSIESKYVDYGIRFNVEVETKEDIDQSEEKNGLGIYELTRTMNDTFPIYYYRGDVDNNNVKFGGYCWKIVRTTSTGGTKIIYNGEPKENGSCSDDTADSHIIGTSSFGNNNSDYVKTSQSNSYYNVYGERMTYKYGLSTSANLNFSTSYTYDTNTHKYILDNPEQHVWSSDYSSLKNYYTCSLSSAESECSSIWYVLASYSSSATFFKLENGKTLQDIDTTIAISDSYVDNGNGTYTLKNAEHIKKSEWPENYYRSFYYVCLDNNETCSNIKSINKKDVEYIWYTSADDPITFAKSITYDGTNYILHDTIDCWDFSVNNQEEIYNLYYYDYTFQGLSDHTSVYKIYSRNYTAYNGTSISMIVNEINNGNLEPVRSTDSSIKTVIDNWYTTNLSTVSTKIEDTPYCNDTRKYRINMSGSGISLNSYAIRRGQQRQIDLNCNDYDSYTVGNTGNGLLTYPIGLLTYDEVSLAGVPLSGYGYNNSYLKSESDFYLMTPYTINKNACYSQSSGGVEYSIANKGVRPAISLKNSVQITSGIGTLSDPYIVS